MMAFPLRQQQCCHGEHINNCYAKGSSVCKGHPWVSIFQRLPMVYQELVQTDPRTDSDHGVQMLNLWPGEMSI